MARQNSIDNSSWPEIYHINSFAVFIGYLSMGVRGLGLLVVTWTTVVLLGGFVSDLHKKDFWSLTVITLIQTAGVFDFLIEEKSGDIVNSLKGLLSATATVLRRFKKDKGTSISEMDHPSKARIAPSKARIALAFVLLVVQALVLAIVLCPLVVLYLLGLYISTGIALWRLIQHDYGNADGAANLKPALNVLYSLAVAQGLFFSYKTMYAWGARTGLAESVARFYSLQINLVSDYLDETLTGCMKDPSFSRGRNLVTYALDLLMEPKSPGSYLSGIRMLGAFLQCSDIRRIPWSIRMRELRSFTGQDMLIKQLLTASSFTGQDLLIKQLLTASSSFRHIIQRLMDALGPRSPYSRELREHAARIVAHVAGDIRLEQFPGGLQCISSLLDSSEEHCWRPEGYERDPMIPEECERDWLVEKHERYHAFYMRVGQHERVSKSPDSESNGLHGYKGLVVQGLCILQRLAVHEDNCRVISNTLGLLSKIMAPLISDELHGDHHDEWSSIAEESLQLMIRLMATPGKTGKKLRREISSNNKKAIISTLRRIIECHKCEVFLKRQAVEILLDLSVDTSSITASGSNSKKIFIWILLHIFLLTDNFFHRMWGSTHWLKKSSYIRKLAGDKLQAVLPLQSEGSATSMLQSLRAFLDDLTRTLLVHAENNTNRVHAADILRHIYRYYEKDDEYLEEVKKSITEVVPEVLREILGCGSTREESAPGIDIEKGGDSQDNGQESTSSSHQQNGEQHELQEALISLCRGIWLTLRYIDQVNEIAAKICSEQKKPVKNFVDLLMEARGLLRKKKEELASVQASSSGKT